MKKVDKKVLTPTEEAIHYHLEFIRRYGKGWRDPAMLRHRESIIALIKLRRYIRRHLNA